MSFRTGFGIDFHQLVEGRELWLGGVKIPHHKGALGHSDADVLLHAICDAMLGALALGDIGTHFPDTDPSFKGIDSKILLQKTNDLILHQGYKVVNVDAALCLEAPKIKPHVASMCSTISTLLGVSTSNVSIKATTTEKMGFVGREEGLVAYAVVQLHHQFNKVRIVNRSHHPLPEYATPDSSGMDLRAFLEHPLTLSPLERLLVPTGLHLEIPTGMEAQVRPRSGLAIRQGLTCLNTPGTIDADYRGEIKVILINLSNEPQIINDGDRIAQLVFQNVEKIVWESSAELTATKRNEGGFGHTGTN